MPLSPAVSRRSTALELTHFLASAPARLEQGVRLETHKPVQPGEPILARCPIPWDGIGPAACVRYDDAYWITLDDIARIVRFRLQIHGRRLVVKPGKLKNKITSYLRSLRDGQDFRTVDSSSPFLHLLKKNECIPSLKTQKVFSWFSVPHDELVLDILEDELRLEEMQKRGNACPPSLTGPGPAPAAGANLTQLLNYRYQQSVLQAANLSSSSAVSSCSPVLSSDRPLDHTPHLPSAQEQPSSKPYLCPVAGCGDSFKRREHLQRHERTHTTEKPFSCSICRKRFSRRDNLGAHARRHTRASGTTEPSTVADKTFAP